jgi:hypothetical protein
MNSVRGCGLDSPGSEQEPVTESFKHVPSDYKKKKMEKFLTNWATISSYRITVLHGVGYYGFLLILIPFTEEYFCLPFEACEYVELRRFSPLDSR